MAIDFTGTTNVFIGGAYNKAATSLQAVYQGETNEWMKQDEGYVWRLVQSTWDGNEAFSVGDVVCLVNGTSSYWTNMSHSGTYQSTLYFNYVSGNIQKIGYDSVRIRYSDEYGTDGKLIGWHLSDADVKPYHAYTVSHTKENGKYARLMTHSTHYLSIDNSIYKKMMLDNSEHWWCTSSQLSGGSLNLPYGYIMDDKATPNFAYGTKTVSGISGYTYTTNHSSDLLGKRYNVVLKRVKVQTP